MEEQGGEEVRLEGERGEEAEGDKEEEDGEKEREDGDKEN